MGTTKTSTWLGRTGTALAEGGVRHVLIKFVHWLTHRWVDFGGIYVFLGQLNWPDPPSLPMDIFFASAEDIPRLIRDLLPERSAAELQARFSRGDSCVAAAVPGGPIVHTHWFSRRYAIINEIGRQFALGPDEVYFYDSFTSLQRRGQGIERAATPFTFEWLRNQGVTRSYGYARSDNPRRLKGLRKVDQFVGTIWFIRFKGARALTLFNKRKITMRLEAVAPEARGGHGGPAGGIQAPSEPARFETARNAKHRA